MEGAVFSIFWVLAAFVAGGLCGMLVPAWVRRSEALSKRSARALKEELHGLDLGGSTVI
jgi:hypothetical protein